MFPSTRTPKSPTEDFAAECKRRFVIHCQARALCPFHIDKRKYEAMAWAEVDAYLDWLDVQAL